MTPFRMLSQPLQTQHSNVSHQNAWEGLQRPKSCSCVTTNGGPVVGNHASANDILSRWPCKLTPCELSWCCHCRWSGWDPKIMGSLQTCGCFSLELMSEDYRRLGCPWTSSCNLYNISFGHEDMKTDYANNLASNRHPPDVKPMYPTLVPITFP